MYKVLIVEDEAPVRNTIIESIDWASVGLDVAYAAGDGQEALDYLEEHQIDLIITDIYMPFINGMELIRRVRETNRYCKVIFLTGYDEFEYAKEAVDLEASKYLLKPITKEELLIVLKEMKNALDDDIKAMQNLHKLEKEYERNIELLRDKLLYDIIEGFIPRKRIAQACENLSYDLEAPYYRVGVLEVIGKEKISQGVWQDDYSLLQFAIYNICKEIFEKEKHTKVLLGKQGRITIVFTTSSMQEFEIKSYNALTKALHSIKRIYEIPLTAGLSDVCSSVGDLKLAYKEALSAIEYTVLEGNDHVIVKSDIEPGKSCNNSKLKSYIEKMIAAMRVNKADQLKDYLKLYFELIKFDKYSLNEVKTLLLSLITAMFDAYNQICVKDTMKKTLDFYLVEQIYALESLSDLEKNLEEVFRVLSEDLRKLRDDDKHHLVMKAIVYVETNYSDPCVNLNSMGELLHVSVSYFSRIFKAAKEQTFIEYLTKYRINKAKDFLKTTDNKVYEIAMEVGYEDARYFSHNFRKHVGMTPLQFRKV